MFKKWNINDTPEITIPEMNENLDKIENALKVAELDNLIVNGDFSDGTRGWTGYQTTLNVENNVLSATTTSTSNNTRLEYVPKINSNGTDLFYLSFRIMVDKQRDVDIFLGSVSNILRNLEPNEWTNASIIRTISTDLYRIYFYGDRKNVAIGNVNYYDNVSLINLTQTFGAGNEPSKEFCDSIMEVVGWFDGKYDLTIQEMFIIIAKWSQAQNVNQIMTLPNFDETE